MLLSSCQALILSDLVIWRFLKLNFVFIFSPSFSQCQQILFFIVSNRRLFKSFSMALHIWSCSTSLVTTLLVFTLPLLQTQHSFTTLESLHMLIAVLWCFLLLCYTPNSSLRAYLHVISSLKPPYVPKLSPSNQFNLAFLFFHYNILLKHLSNCMVDNYIVSVLLTRLWAFFKFKDYVLVIVLNILYST